jgi:hypothetical protein
MTDTWYLLYKGSSCDGTGFAAYFGRTTSEKEARKYFKTIKGPYDFGFVEIVTDSSKTRMTKK